MDDPDLRALRRLVGDVDHFAAQHWGRRPLLRPSGTDFADLISVTSIEQMLLTGIRQPAFRMVRDGGPLPPQRSSATVRLGGSSVGDVADVQRIAAEMADGATLVMQGLQRTSLEVSRFCRQLERAVSHPVQANAYLSPSNATGLRPHADDHDVLVLQVTGAKDWDVEDLGEVRTDPGDVLYLPAGCRHAASTQGTASLHLTIGIVRVTHGAMLRRALNAAIGDVLDRPLPLGFARPERSDVLRQTLSATLESAAGALPGLEVRTLAEVERARAARRRPALLDGQLGSTLALAALTGSSRVQLRPDAQATLTAPEAEAGGTLKVVLVLADRRLRLPAPMGPAVREVLRGEPVEVASLPGLDEGSQLVLVRRLVREGVVVLCE